LDELFQVYRIHMKHIGGMNGIFVRWIVLAVGNLESGHSDRVSDQVLKGSGCDAEGAHGWTRLAARGQPELEVNLSTTSADAAATRFVQAGGSLIVPPFDIDIGRCVVAQDPWGNRLVRLDHTRGRLLINADREAR